MEETALIDMINDGVEEFRIKYACLIYGNFENGSDDYNTSLQSWLKPFELRDCCIQKSDQNLLSKNGADKTGFSVGTKVSIRFIHAFSERVRKYQIIYFCVRGRAEPFRLLLRDCGIDYEEVFVEGEVWTNEWKPKMAFGQLPALKDNNFLLVQSNAILRHLARKHDLYGDNVEEAALIDMINDGIEDQRVKYLTMIYTNYEKGKNDYIADLPSKFQPFEKLLSKNGAEKSGYCVGNRKSFADYNLADLLDINLVLAPNCLDDFPTLSAFHKLIMARPAIVEYHETDDFKKRQINGNGKQ